MSQPKRIASLLASATEILYGIGVGDRVVAVSHECDFPEDIHGKPRATFSRIDSSQSSQQIDTQVKQRLQSGEPLYEVDWGLLASLQVDLIVTQAQCDVCSVRYRDVIERVESDDSFRYTEVAALNPNSITDVLADIIRLGESVEAVPSANQFVDELSQRIDAVTTVTSALGPSRRPRVALVEWTDPLMLAGNWMPELVEAAGGRCPSPASGAASAYARWEELRQFDPQVIIVAPCGFDLQRSLEEVRRMDTALWRDTQAGRSGRVFAVDGNAYFNRSGPRLIESLEILAHLLHPAQFGIPLLAEYWEQTVAQIGN